MRRGIVYVLGVVLLATGAFAQSYVPRGGGGAATCTSGDVKSAVLSSDHDKWVLLNGRAKSALTGAQQTTRTCQVVRGEPWWAALCSPILVQQPLRKTSCQTSTCLITMALVWVLVDPVMCF
jgi:hypothetical protein